MKTTNTSKYYDHSVLKYSRDANVNGDIEIFSNCNSKYTSARPYICTSSKILKVQDQLISSGYSAVEICDKVLQVSVGPLNTQSQSSKPRDKSHAYWQKTRNEKNAQKIVRKEMIFNS